MSRAPWLIGLLLLGCGDELSLTAAGEGVAARAPVEVRLRPVCGDGEVQAGEQCDDGNQVDGDGCNRRCQTPCPEGALELIRCGPGRTLEHAYTITSEGGREHHVREQLETRSCYRPSGGALEIVACRQTLEPYVGERACANMLPPPTGGHLCAPTCEGGCGEGEVCVRALFAGSDPPSFTDGRCLPAIGGGVGDACSGGSDCAPGLGCNLVSGYGAEGPAVCMPEDCGQCPEWSRCAPSIDTITGDETGESCFPTLDLPVGTEVVSNSGCVNPEIVVSSMAVADGCAAGCGKIYGCNYQYAGRPSSSSCTDFCRDAALGSVFRCISNRSGCDISAHESACIDAFNADVQRAPFYCSEACSGRSDCPAGFFCATDFLSNGYGRCVLSDPSDAQAPPESISVTSRDTSGCPEDVDFTCAFGSECDPECARPLGCGETPARGVCQGQRLLYCDQSRIMSVDCAARGLRCAFDAELRRFDCLRGG